MYLKSSLTVSNQRTQVVALKIFEVQDKMQGDNEFGRPENIDECSEFIVELEPFRVAHLPWLRHGWEDPKM